MNQNETRTLWISIGAAIFAVFLLYSYTQEKSAELTKKFGAKQRVVVAKKNIKEMVNINDSMLEVKEQPVDFIGPGAISNPEEIIGKVAIAPIKKGEQILDTKVQDPSPYTGLALQVAPSKRAFSIPIDEFRGVAKLIKPGDRIDIIAALDVGKGANQRREIKTILQDVVILATGLRISNELPRLFEKQGNDQFITNLKDDTSFSTITIEASPSDAQNLIYILSTSPSSLFLTLRHPSDHTKKRLPPTTINSVLGLVKVPKKPRQIRAPAKLPPAPAPKPKPRGPFIDI